MIVLLILAFPPLPAHARPDVTVSHGELPSGWRREASADAILRIVNQFDYPRSERYLENRSSAENWICFVTVRWANEEEAAALKSGRLDDAMAKDGFRSGTGRIMGFSSTTYTLTRADIPSPQSARSIYQVLHTFEAQGAWVMAELSVNVSSVVIGLDGRTGADVMPAAQKENARLKAELNRIVRGLKWAGPGATGGEETAITADNGDLWRTAVGTGAAGAAAVAAAASAIAGLAGRKPRRNGKKSKKASPDEKKIAGYVLQLGTNRISLKPGARRELIATVWRVDSGGRYLPAHDAELELSIAGLAGVEIAPVSGRGKLTCVVSAVNDAAGGAGTISVRAAAGGGVYTGIVEVNVEAGAPEIDARPDLVEFAEGSGASETVRVWVENGGGAKWSFRAEYRDSGRRPAVLDLTPSDDASAVLTLTESGAGPAGADPFETSVIRIIAESKEAGPLERQIKVVAGREGLSIDRIGRNEEGMYIVAADGSEKATEIDFRVLIFDAAEKKIRSDPELVKTLAFELLEPAGSPAANVAAFGRLAHPFADIRAGNLPSGAYRFKMEKPIPSDGETIPVSYRVSVPLRPGEEFTETLRLGLRTSGLGVGGRQWRVELEKCEKIIRDYVPTEHWPKMQELLDKRKMVLGPEGLFYLRKKIWKITQQFVLAEGERAYEDEAKWADRVVSLCEWTEWVSDLVFESFATAAYGPHGGAGAKILKDMVKSAAVCYAEGRSAEEWFNQQMLGLLSVVEGKGIDAVFKVYESNPAKCWALFVSYAFLRNLVMKGDTIHDAAKGAFAEASGKAIGDWMVRKIAKHPQFADFFKTDVPENEAVFWSGADGKTMANRNGSPLGKTKGGEWGENTLVDLGMNPGEAIKAWENLSRKYAKQAKGNVKVYLEKGMKPDSIFSRIEYPELMKNSKITGIEVYVKKGGQWVREWAHKKMGERMVLTP